MYFSTSYCFLHDSDLYKSSSSCHSRLSEVLLKKDPGLIPDQAGTSAGMTPIQKPEELMKE